MSTRLETGDRVLVDGPLTKYQFGYVLGIGPATGGVLVHVELDAGGKAVYVHSDFVTKSTAQELIDAYRAENW